MAVLKEQSKLKSYIKNFVKSKNLKITESSRHCYHIRFPLKGSIAEYNVFFRDIDIEVFESNDSCSSKSKTYILKTKKQINEIPKNTLLYWVNNEISQSKTGSKLFATKDLSPDKLGVTGKLYNTEELIKDVSDFLIKEYNQKISKQLIDLLIFAKTESLEINIKETLTFHKDDLTVISKDFGEILSAIWIMSNLNFREVYFPKNSNEKLIDFYGKRISICYPVSVKSGKGGKVLLQNIIDTINKRKKINKHKIHSEASLKIIKIVNENSAKSQMIKIHQYLETKMIEDLANIMEINSTEITLNKLINWTNSKSTDELKIILKNWWIDYSQPRERTLSGNDKERFILSPLGEKIKYILNNSIKIKESLNFLAKQISILQINIDVRSSKIIFRKSYFKDSKFEFGWPGYSSGNKLGFRLVN